MALTKIFSTNASPARALNEAESVFSSIGGTITDNGSEAQNQLRFGWALTVDDGYVRVTTNDIDNDTTVKFRDDGANAGPSITVTGDTTGVFTDSTSTSVASGSLCAWNIIVGATGMHGDQINFQVISCTLEHADTQVCHAVYSGENHRWTELLTDYFPIIGGIYTSVVIGSSGSENEGYKIRSSQTLSNARTYIPTNQLSGDSTFTLRDDAADTAMVITATGSTTGVFTYSGSITPATGSVLNWKVVTGADGGSSEIDGRHFSIECTNGNILTGLGTRSSASVTAGTTSYLAMGGDTSRDVTTESQRQSTARCDFTALNLKVNVASNGTTGGTSTVALRLDGSDTALVATITAGTTGIFEDTSNEVDIVSTDTINYRHTVGTGGDMALSEIGVELISSAPDLATTNDIESFVFCGS